MYKFFLKRRRSRYALASVALLTLLLTGIPVSLAAAQGLSAQAPQTWDVQVGVTLNPNEIEGMVFLPHDIFINVGDTVRWSADSDGLHTVTFLQPGQSLPVFSMHDPMQDDQQGGSHYDGHSYYNSGLMGDFTPNYAAVVKSYSLTFDVPGDFTYYCLTHHSMIGVVHVRPAGTSYPYTQNDYDGQAHDGVNAVQQDGQRLVTAQRKYGNDHYVIVGAGDGGTSTFGFFPGQIKIRVGDTVTFEQADGMVPHTITYGTSPLSDDVPYGDPNAFDGFSALNSGWLSENADDHGTYYTIKFVRNGVFTFWDDLNKHTMRMTVVVTD